MGKVLEIVSGKNSCEELDKLRDEIELFCKIELDAYNQKVSGKCKNRTLSAENTKNFYDAVWGTIEINEGEIYIINCPVLQRLRRIKQLGLADLLYSSANHSRLSHTLGVLQTASSMWQQIDRELRKRNVPIDSDIEQIIRLAAIFHDCGHMFCSHATERFFQTNISCRRNKSIEAIRNFFKKKLEIKPSLSEIISLLIVNSQSVRELITYVDSGLKGLQFTNNRQDNIIEKICCLIIGFPYSTKTIPYSQIISGQIDSDKLDYLRRDSHMTGVPVAVDMSRVFQKLRMVQTDYAYSMLSDTTEAADKVYKLGIAPAAINTVDQLVISRYMMFENIYFHQKVLTAEEMLRYALQILDESTEGILNDFSVIMQYDDSIIINQNFIESISVIPGIKYSVTDENKFDDACRILKMLCDRELFKRCVAFTSENLTDIGQFGKGFYEKIFISRLMDERDDFIKFVKNEVENIKRILPQTKYNFCNKTDLILIITPEISSASLNSNIAIADKINKDRNMIFEADNWLKSRSTRKPQNYLVSYEEDRYIVYIAVEKVLFDNYGLLINDTILYDENDEKRIAEIKNDLDSKKYYEGDYALLPDEEIKRYTSTIIKLVDKWKTYQYFNVERGERLSIDYSKIVSFIMQFYRFRGEIGDFDVFVRGCINLLNSVVVLERRSILDALKSNIETIIQKYGVEKEDIQICYLGNAQDSGSQISYQINDINNCYSSKISGPLKACQLEQLEPAEVKHTIVFVDDAFSSAKQILSMMETYMGVPIDQRQTKEQHVVELSSEMKNKLKDSNIIFSFIYYNEDNKEMFINHLNELGLRNVDVISKNTFPDGYFKVDESEEKGIVKKYFEAAGKMLIEEKSHNGDELKAGWTDERISQSYLGYNDAQQLIVFPWNTPTYTLTALWLSSRSSKWYPLFQRLDK